MKIELRLLAHLKRYLPDSEQADDHFYVHIHENASAREIIESLGVPPYIPKIVIINDRKGSLDDIPKDGDQVTVCALTQAG